MRKPLVIKKELAEKLKRRGQTRSYCEIIAPQVVRTFHPCGHTSDIDYADQIVSQRMSAEGVKFMARYWSDGGVTATCPKCEKAKRMDPANKHKHFLKSKVKSRIGPDWIAEK